MRIAIPALVLLLVTPTDGAQKRAIGPEASTVKPALRARCLAAIDADASSTKGSGLKETMGMDSGGHYLFEFRQPDGARVVCQICDEANPNVDCGLPGLRLAYQPAGGELRDLPAELDRKCVYFLQKEVTRSPAINRAVIQRTRVTPEHTARSWLYMMNLDEKEYRCVVRKSDGNFRVEEKKGDTWRPIATGILF